MARATTTKVASVLLLLHTAAASKHSTQWGSATSNLSRELPGGLSIDTDTTGDDCIGSDQAQYPSSRRRKQPHICRDDKARSPLIIGAGREFTLFDQRGGDSDSPSSSSDPLPSNNDDSPESIKLRSSRYAKNYPTGGGFSPPTTGSRRNTSVPHPSFNIGGPLAGLRDFLTSSGMPKIQCRVEPNTTLKVRKTFRPLKTKVELGADFNTQLGVWQFQSSWEDRIIGGRLTLAGREMQFRKTWLISVGVMEDLVTRLRLRAAVDLGTMKAYARLGFRTERLSPINVVEGFTLVKSVPLDGYYGHVKLEVKANLAFPEPEIEYSTENHRSFVGMGDIEVNINELNLLLNY